MKRWRGVILFWELAPESLWKIRKWKSIRNEDVSTATIMYDPEGGNELVNEVASLLPVKPVSFSHHQTYYMSYYRFFTTLKEFHYECQGQLTLAHATFWWTLQNSHVRWSSFWRRRGKLARPYMSLLCVLILLTVPSTDPWLQGNVSPALTAS